jgi:hypothetical protein
VRRSFEPGHSKWSEIFLQEVLKAVSLGLAMESLLSEEEVCSRQTRITAKKGFTFDSTVGSRSNFYSSFQRLFSLE